MNIEAALLKEHSRKQTDKIVRYIGNDKKKFGQLMDCFFNGEYRLSQRAAWSVSYCIKEHPELIKPYFKKLLDNLEKPGLHDSIPRNTIRLMQFVEIPKKFHGRVMDTCFKYISSPETAVAIKAFSLSVLQQLAKHYPEITNEIRLVIEERWDYESAAFKSRARNLFKNETK